MKTKNIPNVTGAFLYGLPVANKTQKRADGLEEKNLSSHSDNLRTTLMWPNQPAMRMSSWTWPQQLLQILLEIVLLDLSPISSNKCAEKKEI